MEDQGFMAAAEWIIRLASDRFGDLAGWIVGIVVLVLVPLLIVWAAVEYIT